MIRSASMPCRPSSPVPVWPSARAPRPRASTRLWPPMRQQRPSRPRRWRDCGPIRGCGALSRVRSTPRSPGNALGCAFGVGTLGLAGLLGLAGCVTTAPPPDALVEATRLDASRFVVIAVPNEIAPARLHLGGTAFDYGDQQAYAVSDGARRTMRALASRYHLQYTQSWPIGLLHLQCAVFALPAGAAPEALLAQLQQDKRMAIAEPLHDYEVLTTPDSYAAVQTSNERMKVGQAHLISRGRGVRLALIHTGLASDHPELRGRIEVQRNFVDDDARRFQLDRHGTAIAGVIAANAHNGHGITGIAPQSRLLAPQASLQLQQRP